MAVRIKPLRASMEDVRIRMVLYGEPGVGKTTLCDTLPNTLFLEFDPEGHYSIIGSPHDNLVAEITNMVDLQVVYEALVKDLHGIQTIVFDSMTSLQEMSINFQRAHSKHAVEGIDWIADLDVELRDYKMTKRQISKILAFFAMLPVNLIYVCHTREVDEENKTIVVPDLIPSLRNHICKNASVIARLIIRREVNRETNKAANVRYLVCTPQAGYIARSRLSTIQGTFRNPDLNALFTGVTDQSDTTQDQNVDQEG